MPHLIKKINGEYLLSAATEAFPFGPGFDAEVVSRADYMEVWGSDFSDSGSDWAEFKLFSEKNNLIGRKRVIGY